MVGGVRPNTEHTTALLNLAGESGLVHLMYPPDPRISPTLPGTKKILVLLAGSVLSSKKGLGLRQTPCRPVRTTPSTKYR